MVPPVVKEIQDYDEAVRGGKITCTLDACPCCDKEGARFKLHEVVDRTFWVIVCRLVKKFLTRLTRWKCVSCGKTFRLYPVFGLKYKRYVRDNVLGKSRKYTEKEDVTYRRCAQKEHLQIFHGTLSTPREAEQADDAKSIDDRFLSHTTIYRWISWLGKQLSNTLRAVIKQIQAAHPRANISRRVFPVSPFKYRSDRRRRCLQQCRKFLSADDEFHSLFDRSIFPDFATRHGWR